MTPQTLVLLFTSTALGSVGQYFFKSGMAGAKVEGLALVLCLFRPLVLVGLVCYGLATLVWLKILSNNPLSLVYPFISISYIVVVLMGQFVFKESVSWVSWAGVGLICLGVVCVGIGGTQKKVSVDSGPSVSTSQEAVVPAAALNR